MKVFIIDLDSPRPSVLEFSGTELADDLEYFGETDPLELADFDRKIFQTEREACDYLVRYLTTLRGLRNEKICLSRTLPCMLLKRRYIVQTLLGEKLHTERHYDKKWKPGTLFNFHDQTYFLTVKLTAITEMYDEEGQFFRYDFELPKIGRT